MSERNIEELSKEELIRLIHERDDRIKELSKGRIDKSDPEIIELQKMIDTISKDKEVSLEQIYGALGIKNTKSKSTKPRKSKTHTHRHPDDETLTCVRGAANKAEWLKKWLAEGHTEEELVLIVRD